jgi:hypothetical protein
MKPRLCAHRGASLLLWPLLAALGTGCHSDHDGARDQGVAADQGVPDLAAPVDLSGGGEDGASDGAPPDLFTPDLAGCTVCSSVCLELSSDPQNCGACGHVCGCGSTSCTNGVCDPMVLADKQGGPFTLARDGSNLYWGNDADMNLSTVPITGGGATVLFPGRTLIRGMVFDTTHIYFSRVIFNIVEAGLLNGTSSGNFTNQQESGAAGMAIDATNVYWVTNSTGLVRTKAIGAGGGGTTLLSGQSHPIELAVDGDSLYWTTNDPSGTVMKMPKTGGVATPLATAQPSPRGLAIDAGYVYWINQGDGTSSNGSVNRVDKAGVTITPIASGRMYPYELAVDADSVYWTDLAAGTVEKAPLAGGASTQLAAGQNQPLGLALDAECVYFSSYAGDSVGKGAILKSGK